MKKEVRRRNNIFHYNFINFIQNSSSERKPKKKPTNSKKNSNIETVKTRSKKVSFSSNKNNYINNIKKKEFAIRNCDRRRIRKKIERIKKDMEKFTEISKKFNLNYKFLFYS